jgi:hypothetical protein
MNLYFHLAKVGLDWLKTLSFQINQMFLQVVITTSMKKAFWSSDVQPRSPFEDHNFESNQSADNSKSSNWSCTGRKGDMLSKGRAHNVCCQ